MILKHYVQIENGMVYKVRLMYETDKGKSFSIENDYNEQFAIYMESKVPDRRSGIAMGQLGDVIATSDDIFDLITQDWLGKFSYDTTIGIVTYTEEINASDIKYYRKHDELTDIIALYAPVTRNGEIVSYELVWKKEDK